MNTPPADITNWLKNPNGGEAWPALAKKIRAHDPDCESLQHAWLPRTGRVSDLSTSEDCDQCWLTVQVEGLHLIERRSHDQWLCHCCYAKELADMDPLPAYDVTVPSRIWWNRGGMGYWWRLLYWGRDENCNGILSIRIPFGTVNIAMTVPLRRKPCKTCIKEGMA